VVGWKLGGGGGGVGLDDRACSCGVLTVMPFLRRDGREGRQLLSDLTAGLQGTGLLCKADKAGGLCEGVISRPFLWPIHRGVRCYLAVYF